MCHFRWVLREGLLTWIPACSFALCSYLLKCKQSPTATATSCLCLYYPSIADCTSSSHEPKYSSLLYVGSLSRQILWSHNEKSNVPSNNVSKSLPLQIVHIPNSYIYLIGCPLQEGRLSWSDIDPSRV